MNTSDSSQNSDSAPISEQFAEVLQADIKDYVESLSQLDRPEVEQELQSSRERMLYENVIKQSALVPGLGSMVAVDGGNNVLNIGLGTQCFVLSVRYSLRQNYDVRISMQRLAFEQEEAAALMYGVRNAMEVRDIYEANEQDSFCIVDNSWVSLLKNVNRTLVNYRRNHSFNDQQILEGYLRPMLSKNGHFVNVVRHLRNIAISKAGLSRFYCDKYGEGKLNILDKVFLLGVLKAGEYTEPRPLKDSGFGQLNVHTDPIFESQDTIKEIYNSTLSSTGSDCICSTYFKPYDWSPVKRIEFHRELLRNGKAMLFQMLATVRESMSVPTIHEPIEQFVVDQIVKRHSGRLPGLYQTVGVANIQNFDTSFASQLVRRFRS